MKPFFLILLILLLLITPNLSLAGSSQLDLHQNALLAATDGRDAYFFVTVDKAGWGIQSALNSIEENPPLYILDTGRIPYGVLHANAANLWYACYNPALFIEEEKETQWAVTIFRLDRATGKSHPTTIDVSPQSLFPGDGDNLYYVPWQNPHALRCVDFLTGDDYLVAEMPGQRFQRVVYSQNKLYAILAPDSGGGERLYRIDGDQAKRLFDPNPRPYASTLTGDYRVYRTREDPTEYYSSLTDPGHSQSITRRLLRGKVHRYGNVLFTIDEEIFQMIRFTYLDLEGDLEGRERSLMISAPAYPPLYGYGGGELVMLDSVGRLISASEGLTSLHTLARLDLETLYAQGTWSWALPFEDFVLLLGDATTYRALPGEPLPPQTMARVIPVGEGIAPRPQVRSNENGETSATAQSLE